MADPPVKPELAVHGIVTGMVITLVFSETATVEVIELPVEHSVPVGNGTVNESVVVYVGLVALF